SDSRRPLYITLNVRAVALQQVEQRVRLIRWYGKGHHDQRLPCFRKRSWFVLAARHSPMGDGSYLCFVRHTEIHTPVRCRHCIIYFQQSVRFVAVYLWDQRRGLSARYYRVNDSRSSRCRRIYPDSISTRLIDGNWYVRDYVVVFLLDTRCRKWSISTDPIAWNLTGEFLYKDVVLLCVCIVLFLASLPKKVVPLRSN